MDLKETIDRGQVFFITGAGASFDSGLVEPKEAIAGTCAKLLPSFATADIENGAVATAITPAIKYCHFRWCPHPVPDTEPAWGDRNMI